MAVTIQINSASLREFYGSMKKFEKGVEKDLIKRTRAAAINIHRNAILTVHKNTPKAFNSIKSGMEFSVSKNKPSARVWNTVHWAPYIEYGTVAHVIKPKNAGALYFYSPALGMAVMVPKKGGFRSFVNKDGILVSGKGYVNHPGTQAQPFMAPAARKEEKAYFKDIDLILKRRIKTK